MRLHRCPVGEGCCGRDSGGSDDAGGAATTRGGQRRRGRDGGGDGATGAATARRGRRRRDGGGDGATGAATARRGRRRRDGGGDGATGAATARRGRRRRDGGGDGATGAATARRGRRRRDGGGRHPGGSGGGGSLCGWALAGSLFPGGRRLTLRQFLCARDGGACRTAAAPRHWRGTERGRGRPRLSPARRRDAAAGAAGARVPVSEAVGRGPGSCMGVCAAASDGGGKGGMGGVRRLVAAAPAVKDPHVARYAVQRDGAGALKTAGGAHAGGGRGVTRDGRGTKEGAGGRGRDSSLHLVLSIV
ncbi:hypothetical protein BU14_0261s0006 [Porphyra umbilicalis]|uniref:Uncharacterized protein n=1 Tax=Porphyra umbilicalis TaxID=2786 RepID=A0A1X6P2C0_PORUM|nr:hypothetical protein BU14_0261s0006 [Porphyra umbilicalis]|eukprot:OSX74915.1 hypothetical protein BU14_0261s0006 [Porphyra umbilicalis]